MGNHTMGHCQTWVNLASPRMLKAIVVEIQRQTIRIEVIQSLNAIISTTWVETILAPNINVVGSAILIGSATSLGRGLSRILAGKRLSKSSRLPKATTIVVVTPQWCLLI
jgi:glycopeptide antibiotics resistance protein